MLSTYTYPRYDYRQAPELGAAQVRRVPLVVVGAGPVGLAAAIDAAQLGLPVVLLDDDNTVSVGSRGLCYAKRALEVLDRLGVGDPVVAKGVTWNVGRTFHRDTEVFSFNLLPEAGHRRPGMVNLQQYWLEQFMVERALQLPGIELRWQPKVTGLSQRIIVEASARLGIQRRTIGQEEIIRRLNYPMINEGAKILEEGIAQRPSDIDVIWVYGYGWPVYRGGPMFWADQLGLKTIRDRMLEFRRATGDERWTPAPLLDRLATAGKGFVEA